MTRDDPDDFYLAIASIQDPAPSSQLHSSSDIHQHNEPPLITPMPIPKWGIDPQAHGRISPSHQPVPSALGHAQMTSLGVHEAKAATEAASVTAAVARFTKSQADSQMRRQDLDFMQAFLSPASGVSFGPKPAVALPWQAVMRRVVLSCMHKIILHLTDQVIAHDTCRWYHLPSFRRSTNTAWR